MGFKEKIAALVLGNRYYATSFNQSDSRRCPLVNCVWDGRQVRDFFGYRNSCSLYVLCMISSYLLYILHSYHSFLCHFYHPLFTPFCYFTFVCIFVTLSTDHSKSSPYRLVFAFLGGNQEEIYFKVSWYVRLIPV